MSFIILFIALILIDQGVKYLTLVFLKPIGTYVIINNVFSLTYVENTGAAFGIFQNSKLFLIAIPCIIIIGIVYYFFNIDGKYKEPLKITMIFILAGAVSNLIDRIFRHFVVDMFEFTFVDFAVFNVADIYIVLGSMAIVIFTLLSEKDGEI